MPLFYLSYRQAAKSPVLYSTLLPVLQFSKVTSLYSRCSEPLLGRGSFTLSVTTGTGGETDSRQSERVANIIYHAGRGDIGRQVDSPTRSVRVCLYTKIDTMEIWTKYIEWTGIES